MSPQQDKTAYRVLAAVGSPEQLAPLLAVSCALARAHDGEVTLLSVTPSGQQPEWFNVPLEPASPQPGTEDSLGQLPDECRGTPLNAVFRVGQQAGPAILAAVREDPPDLLVLGWRGVPASGRYLLGSTLDPLIQKAPCDVAVVRIRDKPEHVTRAMENLNHVLIPMRGDLARGGGNAALAVELALDLAPDVEVTALNVAPLSRGRAGIQIGQEQLVAALKPWQDNPRVRPKVLQAPGVIGGILSEAKSGYDLILIGASRERYIDRVMFGNVPHAVAADSPVPTIVVRRPEGWHENSLQRAWQWIAKTLPALTVAERVEVYRTVRRGARPDVDFFLMIGLSAILSTLGLLLNSVAVIIGAMLVAPLMSPIVGLGLGVMQGDWRLLRLAASATLRGMLLAILVSMLVGLLGVFAGLLAPGVPLRTEIMARTTPGVLDLVVALVSGAAGAYAISRKDVATALPGVAIAAALVPPLGVVGIGLALGNGHVAGGALLLFFTNLVAVSVAAGLIFLWLGFRPELSVQSRARVFAGGLAGFVALILAVTLPLGLFTMAALREARVNRTIAQALEAELDTARDVELVDWQIVEDPEETALTLDVTVRARRELGYQDVLSLQEQIAGSLQRPVALRLIVIPVTRLEPVAPPTLTPTATPTLTPTASPTAAPTSTTAATVTSTLAPVEMSAGVPTAPATPPRPTPAPAICCSR